MVCSARTWRVSGWTVESRSDSLFDFGSHFDEQGGLNKHVGGVLRSAPDVVVSRGDGPKKLSVFPGRSWPGKELCGVLSAGWHGEVWIGESWRSLDRGREKCRVTEKVVDGYFLGSLDVFFATS